MNKTREGESGFDLKGTIHGLLQKRVISKLFFMIHCLLYILMSSFYFYLNPLLLFLHVNRSEVNNGIHTLYVTSPTAPLYKNIWDH